MFNSPFGSIFSEEVYSGQLGFLGNQPKPTPDSPAPDSKIEAEPLPGKTPATPEPKIIAEPAAPKEISPKKEAKRKPFSTGAPQL
jgi:hypothetical protein